MGLQELWLDMGEVSIGAVIVGGEISKGTHLRETIAGIHCTLKL